METLPNVLNFLEMPKHAPMRLLIHIVDRLGRRSLNIRRDFFFRAMVSISGKRVRRWRELQFIRIHHDGREKNDFFADPHLQARGMAFSILTVADVSAGTPTLITPRQIRWP